MTRKEVIRRLAGAILEIERSHPVRVAIDGVDAAGKTTLGDGLAAALLASGRPVIRASIDGFHQPAAVRYLRGRMSPDGYYHDAFDYTAFKRLLLDPLGPEGDLSYQDAYFDLAADGLLERTAAVADPQSLLVCDGIFLLRRELRGCWDFAVYLDVSFETARRRGIRRDAERLGGVGEARRRYDERYLPAQRLYLDGARPKQHANVVVQNDDPARPRLTWPPSW